MFKWFLLIGFFLLCTTLVVSSVFLVVYVVFFGFVSFVVWDSSFMNVGNVHGLLRVIYTGLSIVVCIPVFALVADHAEPIAKFFSNMFEEKVDTDSENE